MFFEQLQNPMLGKTIPPQPIHLLSGARMAIADSQITVEQLNATLLAEGLCLPIEPLERDLSLTDLMTCNAGGRRCLRYGTIARYIRSATIQRTTHSNEPRKTLTFGGQTIKRATGYRLPQALVGKQIAPMDKLLDITISLHPLPQARRTFLLSCNTIAAACELASKLINTFSLSALAVQSQPKSSSSTPHHTLQLLIELEDIPAAIEHQTELLQKLLADGMWDITDGGVYDEQPSQLPSTHPHWQLWETLAQCWRQQEDMMTVQNDQISSDGTTTMASLDLLLPRVAIPQFLSQAQTIAHRYHLNLPFWGDIGIGTIYLHLQPFPHATIRASEAQQVAAIILYLAQHMQGSLCTERGQGVSSNLAPEKRGASDVGGWQSQLPTEGDIPPSSWRVEGTPNASDAKAIAHLITSLREVVGAPYTLIRPEELTCYTTDASIAQPQGAPLAVVLPASTAEVSTILQLATHTNATIIPRGAASGLAGGTTTAPGSLVLALTRMNQLSIDTQQMTARVQAGVITADLQRYVESYGLFYPPDPSSQTVSTIGGNIACNAGGPRCLKYGVTADYLLQLTAVLADGKIIVVGDGLNAQSPEAGLMHLLIGSEGTLAIITEAIVRLVPKPAVQQTALAIYDHLEDACTTVESIMETGIVPASLELMDQTTIATVEAYMQLGLPHDAEALLLIQSDGSSQTVAWEMEILGEMACKGGAREVKVAHTSEEEAALWKGRRAIGPSLARMSPNKLGEDISVPVPKIATTVRRIKEIADHYDLTIPVFGHAGDGNLHPNILFNRRNTEQEARVWQAAEAIFHVALEVGGTLSGEHGIGTLKRPFMEAALGEDVLNMQRAIKTAFDPHHRLNPGKVLP